MRSVCCTDGRTVYLEVGVAVGRSELVGGDGEEHVGGHLPEHFVEPAVLERHHYLPADGLGSEAAPTTAGGLTVLRAPLLSRAHRRGPSRQTLTLDAEGAATIEILHTNFEPAMAGYDENGACEYHTQGGGVDAGSALA